MTPPVEPTIAPERESSSAPSCPGPVALDRLRSLVLGLTVGSLTVDQHPLHDAVAVGSALVASEAQMVVVSLPAHLAHWVPTIEDAFGLRTVIAAVDTWVRVSARPDTAYRSVELKELGPDRMGLEFLPLDLWTGWHWRADPFFDDRPIAEAERVWWSSEAAAGRAWLLTGGARDSRQVVAVRPHGREGSRAVAAFLGSDGPRGPGEQVALPAVSAAVGAWAVQRGWEQVLVPVGAHDPAGYGRLLDMGGRPVAVDLTLHVYRTPSRQAVAVGTCP